jgi:hypothetical protein
VERESDGSTRNAFPSTLVILPQDDEEAVKFVRGATLAYPKLYFARFVVLHTSANRRTREH